MKNTQDDTATEGCAPAACSALDEQRNALAEARMRIIERAETVATWLKQPAPENTLTNWAGMVEGLNQARRIIGAMWDELPVSKPQAVIDHEAHMRRVIEEQNDQAVPAAAGGSESTQEPSPPLGTSA